MKFSGCRDFNSQYENLELPFYFRYKNDLLGDMWFEVNIIREDRGTIPVLDVDKLLLNGSQWDSDTKHWLQTQYITRCFTNLGYSSNLRIRYIHKPLEKNRRKEFL